MPFTPPVELWSINPLVTIPTNITNSPSVSVTNTPSVNVANTPSVSITNTPNVSVTNTPGVVVTNVPNVHIQSSGVLPVLNTGALSVASLPVVPIPPYLVPTQTTTDLTFVHNHTTTANEFFIGPTTYNFGSPQGRYRLTVLSTICPMQDSGGTYYFPAYSFVRLVVAVHQVNLAWAYQALAGNSASISEPRTFTTPGGTLFYVVIEHMVTIDSRTPSRIKKVFSLETTTPIQVTLSGWRTGPGVYMGHTNVGFEKLA